MFVFRIVTFVFVLKCFVTTTYSEQTINSTFLPTKTQINETNVKGINNLTQPAELDDKKAKTPVIDEGGETLISTTAIPIVSTVTTDKNIRQHTDIEIDNTSTSTTRIFGRERIRVDSDNNTSKILNGTDAKTENINTTYNSTSLHYSSHAQSEESKSTTVMPILSNDKSNITRSGSVPKKGVEFPDDLNTTTITTSTQHPSTTQTSTVSPTVAKQIRKPTVTIGSQDDKDALAKPKPTNSTPTVPTIEVYQKNKEDRKRSTFIIPIVAVILSVPLVAIILNILYKRGKEWWTHRHYSRMDFLIDGMYNN